ncbi:hypothetical protein [Nostoc sp. CCY 9925]|uniref:hypothetical protein n=1 Tax=Nostoc sp. CCY 9925 TaxID=3103865 RepID=UPI0039C61FD0
MSAGAGDLQSHFTGVFEWAGGVGAEVLESLGKLKRPYLTDLEEKLLGLLELAMGV